MNLYSRMLLLAIARLLLLLVKGAENWTRLVLNKCGVQALAIQAVDGLPLSSHPSLQPVLYLPHYTTVSVADLGKLSNILYSKA